MNCMRRTEQSIERASALANFVLPTPGHVLDQQVTLGEQHRDAEPDDVVLAVDDLIDVGRDPVADDAHVLHAAGSGSDGRRAAECAAAHGFVAAYAASLSQVFHQDPSSSSSAFFA